METADGQIRLGGWAFCSKRLRGLFAATRAHAAMVVAVSAGPECEAMAHQRWQDNKPDEYFFLETFGSAVVEQLIVVAGGRLCAWAEREGLAVLPHYSPGYSGWDIADQAGLWELIRPGPGQALPGALEVMSSGMLRPKKSQLAVFGLTREVERARRLAGLVPCKSCSLTGCQFRRAPRTHSPPHPESRRW